MRRALSIFLILFFGIGPLSASLFADDDARLPACCRRNGSHHCAMSNAMLAWMAQIAARSPIATAPSHCPAYPGNTCASIASPHAITAAAQAPQPLLVQTNAIASLHIAIHPGQKNVHTGRGPPTSTLS